MPSASETLSVSDSETVYTTDLALQVQRHFGMFEKELRFITLKSEQAIVQLLETARQQAQEIARQEQGEQDLLRQITSCSALRIKAEIARGLRALWPDKYFRHHSYHQLIESHQQLAEAIYAGWLTATLQPGGNLEPPEAEIPLSKPGTRGNLIRDIRLKDTAGNEVGFRKGERCILQEKAGRFFVRKIVRKKTAQLGDPDEYEVWPHPFLLPDRRLIQEAGPRFVRPAQALFQEPVSAAGLRPGKPEKAWLLGGCYALTKVAPMHVLQAFKECDDRVWARMFSQDTQNQSFEARILALEKSLPAVPGPDAPALWVQWVEKAYATFKGSYDAIQEGDVRQLLSSLLGKKPCRIDLSALASTDWKPDQMLADLPEYLMHETVLQTLRNQAEKYSLTDAQLQSLASVSPAEIHDFHQLLDRENETWQSWTCSQQERQDLEATFRQQERALLDQYQSSLDTLKARKDLPPVQLRQEIAKCSQAWDGRLKKLRADYKAARAERDQSVADEARRTTFFAGELQRLTAIGPQQAGLEALIKNSISIMKFKYRPAIFQEEYDQILAELSRYILTNPEMKVDNTSYNSAELLSLLKALGHRQFPARATGATDASKDYSPAQEELFARLHTALQEGRLILAGCRSRTAKSSPLPQSQRFIYPLVDSLELMESKCLKIANPLDEEFTRYYKLQEGKLTLKHSSRDYSRATLDPRAGTYVPEFWLDLRELGSLFDCLYLF